jgi:hypothetical protein
MKDKWIIIHSTTPDNYLNCSTKFRATKLRGGNEKNGGRGLVFAGRSHGFSLDFFFGSFLFNQVKRNEHNTDVRCEANGGFNA